ncbi:uncharacterized protein [Spinacia oleracea]|uniref:DUF868 domain-containing protein n=1 Tax=Spinacia oleracea TaxID=3562 RepID=A0A9R0J441_SPIOL|nr:uncharacterized protein LOC110799902 [Spinacia oleracea]
MRNIATCYSEHAVRVSDSYCSGPLNKSYISPKSNPSIQNVVSCTYKTHISNQKRLYVTISWCSKMICQGFFIKISEKIPRENHYQHGFHQLPKIKGTKSLQDFSSDLKKKLSITVHWDLSAADFEAGPEPIRGFYIVVLVNSRYALVLGDMEIDPALKDLVDGLVLPKVTLVSQCEHYKGQWNSEISSKAKFSEIGVEHEIMIKCWQEEDGPQSPVLSVYIDKKRVVRIKRLQWNFRGNQVIFVDGLLVDVMWDVYGWYFDQTVGGFNSNKGGCGFIMFRTRSGLDSRLWLEEEENKLSDQNLGKPEFSLLICATQ